MDRPSEPLYWLWFVLCPIPVDYLVAPQLERNVVMYLMVCLSRHQGPQNNVPDHKMLNSVRFHSHMGWVKLFQHSLDTCCRWDGWLIIIGKDVLLGDLPCKNSSHIHHTFSSNSSFIHVAESCWRRPFIYLSTVVDLQGFVCACVRACVWPPFIQFWQPSWQLLLKSHMLNMVL